MIPAYNEEGCIARTITCVSKFFPKDQIIVANDGSTDKTLSIAKNQGVKYVSINQNKGKGYILLKTFEKILLELPATKWIITLDADGQHDHNDLPRFLRVIQSNPKIRILVGNRDYTMMPYLNRISNLLTSRWLKYWLEWELDDIQCGYRCYSSDGLRRILNFGTESYRFDFETELLLIAWFLNLAIKQVSISTRYPAVRRRSRITPTIDTLRWINLVSRYAFRSSFFSKIVHKKL